MGKRDFSDQVTYFMAREEYLDYFKQRLADAFIDEAPSREDLIKYHPEIMTEGRFIAKYYPHLMRDPKAWGGIDDEPDDYEVYAKTDFRRAFWDLGYNPSDKDEVWKPTLVEKYAAEVSSKLQFPHDTCFLFALGAVASAMTRQFHYRLNKQDEYTRAPVNLYVVTAQPAGTAKSGVFRNFVSPIQLAYSKINEKQRKERAKLLAKMELLKADVKKAKNEDEKNALLNEIAETDNALLHTPVYVYALDDATAEGLRDVASRQMGFFNMVSEESDLVKVLMGTVYGDGKRKNNNSMFLKAWDGDIISVARSGQDVITTNVKATLAVIAQDEAIRVILEAGLSGQGVNERVLVHREKDMLDTIDYRKRSGSVISPALRAEYQLMISGLVEADPERDICDFYISENGREALTLYMEHMQMKSRVESIYKDPAIMGVVSKGEKQIMKIASVLHGSYIYQKGNARSAEIPEITIRRAIGLFDQLISGYVRSAENQGYAGTSPRIERVRRYIEKCLQQRKYRISISAITDAVRRDDVFSRCVSVSEILKTEVLLEMEIQNMVVVSGKNVFINQDAF